MADLDQTASGQPVYIIGASATGVEGTPVASFSNGALATSDIGGQLVTYSATISNLTVANAATDIFTISGSASKTIKITRIEVAATRNTSGTEQVILLKRSTANSGGTSTTRTAVKHDSTAANATATVLAYTANPTTLGTLVGELRTTWLFISNKSAFNAPWVLDFGTRPAQQIALRGAAESLCINLAGVTIASAAFNISVEWTEE